MVPLDNNKLNLSMRNDLVTPNTRGKLRGMIWIMKNHLRNQNHQVIKKIAKEKSMVPISGKK